MIERAARDLASGAGETKAWRGSPAVAQGTCEGSATFAAVFVTIARALQPFVCVALQSHLQFVPFRRERLYEGRLLWMYGRRPRRFLGQQAAVSARRDGDVRSGGCGDHVPAELRCASGSGRCTNRIFRTMLPGQGANTPVRGTTWFGSDHAGGSTAGRSKIKGSGRSFRTRRLCKSLNTSVRASIETLAISSTSSSRIRSSRRCSAARLRPLNSFSWCGRWARM